MLTLNDGRSELWQWDTGRKLTVDADCSQVHFSNKVFGRSIDVDVIDGVSIIPDILLQTDKDLNAWAFVGTAENGYTKISKTFKVNRRNKPAYYVFTPPDQTSLEEIKEKIDYLESIQDPDAIKNAVDDYLANNPIMVKETDPTVFDWAKRELFNKADLPTSIQSFVTVDGIEYYRYHAGATHGFTWYNPSPLPGAVTITARGVAQYGGTDGTRLKTIYSDGTYGPDLYIVASGESRTVTVTTDTSKTLAKITGNYDMENWVLLDMSVMSVQAEYNRGLPLADSNAAGGVLADPATDADTIPARIKDGRLFVAGATDEQIAQAVSDYLEEHPVEAPEIDLTGVVKSVNGQTPDENGNVEITIPDSGGVSDYHELTNKPKINGVEVSGNKTSADYGIGNPTNEQVATAVQTYLDEHPEATTTVADGSITEQKLVDGAVSAQKAGFLAFVGTSENLFDKSECVDNENVDKNYGSFRYADGICRSAYIPVTPGTVYIRNSGSYLNDSGEEKWMNTCFYDSDKSFISGVSHYRATAFTTPSNAAYLVMCLYMVAKDNAMLVEGDTIPGEYVPYREYFKLGDGIIIGVENIESLNAIFEAMPDGSIAKTKLANEVTAEIESMDSRINTAAGWNDVRQPTKTLTGRINVFEHTVKGVFDIASDISDKTVLVHGVNYFDKNDLVPGKVNNSNGTITDSTTDYYTEHLIPVQPGKKLLWNRSNADGVRSYLTFCYYDQNQQYLRNKVVGGRAKSDIFTPEEDVYFIRVSCVNMVNADAEKICIADVDIGHTAYGGYEGNTSIENVGSGKTYFGKNVYFPYVGYRIENGVLIGASDTYTLEEITHVDVFDSAATIEVTVPVEGFDQKRLQNVTLEFGRHADTDYVIARIFKSTITGDTITPKVLAFTPGGKTMNTLASESDFVMCINAGCFDMSDNSCVGNTISGGMVITDHVASDTIGTADTLAIDSSGNLLSYPYETTTADMLNAGVQHAVHGKGTLITDFEIVDMDEYSEKLGNTENEKEKHPRTVVGQYKNGDYMVFTCGGRETNQAGMTMHEINDILVSKGVKFAYNLDGGGSCNMMFYKKELAPYSESRADPSYIVFD